ncbi:unnamed protein product [Camellia sinensis]
MSNLLRQFLYTLDHCLNGGDFKAPAAIKSLKRIFPAVEAEGVVMAFPMLGHPMPSHEVNSVLEDCRCLHDLIDSRDTVFLLTDTRESQWLSTLLCVNANKGSIPSWLCVTALVLLALFVTSKMMYLVKWETSTKWIEMESKDWVVTFAMTWLARLM